MKSTTLGFKSVHEKISAIQRSTKLTPEQKEKAIQKLRLQYKTKKTRNKLNITRLIDMLE